MILSYTVYERPEALYEAMAIRAIRCTPQTAPSVWAYAKRVCEAMAEADWALMPVLVYEVLDEQLVLDTLIEEMPDSETRAVMCGLRALPNEHRRSLMRPMRDLLARWPAPGRLPGPSSSASLSERLYAQRSAGV